MPIAVGVWETCGRWWGKQGHGHAENSTARTRTFRSESTHPLPSSYMKDTETRLPNSLPLSGGQRNRLVFRKSKEEAAWTGTTFPELHLDYHGFKMVPSFSNLSNQSRTTLKCSSKTKLPDCFLCQHNLFGHKEGPWNLNTQVASTRFMISFSSPHFFCIQNNSSETFFSTL